jgi:hypothetical protein
MTLGIVGGLLRKAEAAGGPVGETITVYATLTALLDDAASLLLVTGYYSVTGVGVFYWDGAAFDPPVVAEGLVTTDTGFLYLPDYIDTDPTTLTLLAPSFGFPGIKDYAGLYTDDELLASGALPGGERGILTHLTRKTSQFPNKPALNLLGECRIRVFVRILLDVANLMDLVDYGNAGETLASNFTWNINLDSTSIDSFSESGAGVDCSASWRFPFRCAVGAEYLFESRRTAGMVETMWVNGLQLRYIPSNTAGTVNNATGEFARVAPAGGTTGLLCYSDFGNNEVDVGFLDVSDDLTVTTAPEFAAGRFAFTAQQIADFNYDDAATKALIAGAVSIFKGTASGIEDETGTIITWGTNTTVGNQLIGEGAAAKHWIVSGYAAVTNPALLIYGDATFNVVMIPNITTSFAIINSQSSGESVATNYLFQISVNLGVQQYGWFHEYGSGINVSGAFDFATPWQVGEIREVRLVREEIGGGNALLRMYERPFGSATWTQLNVATMSPGSGVGTTEATVPSTVGSGASNVFTTGQNFFWRQIDLFNTVIDP